MGYDFDGTSKIIILTLGTTILDVKDMYSRYKEWVQNGGSNFVQALEVVGGDPVDIGQGIYVTSYFFLTNDWKVKPQEASHRLNVRNGVLLTSDGSDPFLPTDGNYNVLIQYSQPVRTEAVVIETGVSGLTEPESIELFSIKTDIKGTDDDTLKTISDQLDTAQADLNNPNQYKADVSSLALEVTLQGVKGETDKISSIKTKTDQLTFTEDNKVDASIDSTSQVQLSQEEHDQIMSIEDVSSSVNSVVQRLPDIEYCSFEDGVSIDTSSPYSGTSFPVGTSRQPVNNLTDAISIAESRGFYNLYFLSDFTFGPSVSIGAYNLIGEGTFKTTFTFSTGSLVNGGTIQKAKIVGAVLGFKQMDDCILGDITCFCPIPKEIDLIILKALINGSVVLSENFSGSVQVFDCWGGLPSLSTPSLDMNHSSINLSVRNYSGNMRIKNNTQSNTIAIIMRGGIIYLESSITSGFFTIKGVGVVEDSSNGAVVDTSALVNPVNVASVTWDEMKSVHMEDGTFGEAFNAIKNKTDQMEFHTGGGILATIDEIIEPALSQIQDIVNDSTAEVRLLQEEHDQVMLIDDIKVQTDKIPILDENLKRSLGLMHENIYIDSAVYDGNNNLTSARVRIYSNPASVGTDNDIIGTYTIVSTCSGAGKFTTWKQTSQ